VSIDEYQFKATWSPIRKESCILWFRDTRVSDAFEALGQFSQFDKRDILFFISRYVTSSALREEIDGLRFERRIKGLSPTFFREIEHMSDRAKEKAYRHLFNLDSQMNSLSLSDRRRIMARNFHPDVGGDNATMTLINQAHDFLAEAAAR
jgi:hypothetical protein